MEEENAVELLQRYRRDRRVLLDYILSGSLIKKVLMPPGAVSLDDVDLDQVQWLNSQKLSENTMIALSSQICSANEFFLVTNPESSGSPPKRAPPPIPASAPSSIPILTPSPAPVLASSPISDLETSPIPPLAASPIMSSVSKSVSLNSTRDRELSIDDIDIDDLEEDDDVDEVDSLRMSRRKPNDAADLVLGLPSFATGITEDDLRETAYEVLLASAGASGGLIVPSKEKKKDRKSKLMRKLGRSKSEHVKVQSQRAPGLVGLLEAMRVQMELAKSCPLGQASNPSPFTAERLFCYALSDWFKKMRNTAKKGCLEISFLKWRERLSRLWRGGVGLVVGAFEESCGVGGVQGFHSKDEGKIRTHLMEICFNNRGRFMKITEIVARRKPLVLVVPEAERASKEMFKESQVSKGMYRGGRSYVDVVAEEGPRNGASMPVGEWARAILKGELIGFKIKEFNSERRGYCYEEMLRYILQKWGKVMKVARESLKLVDLSKVKLWVGMLPNFVLLALLEVEDGAWSFTVAVTVTGEDEGDDFLKPESTRSKDEVLSAGGCVLQKPKIAEGLRATARDNECHSWRPRHRSHSHSSDSKSASKVEKGKGRSILGPTAGSAIGPTPDASFKALSVRAQFGAKCFGPLAGPVHEREAGSSNGGTAVPSSSKLLRSGSSTKEVMPTDHSQKPAKLKGSSVSIRRKARSWLSSLKVSSSVPKLNLEGGGSSEANRAILRGRSLSNKGVLASVPETSKDFTGETEGDEGISRCNLVNKVRHPFLALSEQGLPWVGAFDPKFLLESSVSSVSPSCCQPLFSIPLESSFAFQRGPSLISPIVDLNRRGCVSCSEGVAFPLETSNRNFKDCPFLREPLSNPEEHCVSGKASSPKLEPPTLPLEGFQVEGLTPRKMVKVQSVLESLRIRIVRDNGKGAEVESKNTLSADKILSWNTRGLGSKMKRRTVRRFLSTQSPDVVMLQETKRVNWDRRGIVILWDSNKFKCAEKMLGSFFITVKLNSGEEGSFWLTLVYDLNKPLGRKDFWLEHQDLYGLSFPRWCVGGDFDVIRRIFEKMGDSRLTFNMRCFDEFIRESGLLDPPLRNAAFTWSNMQVVPICKRLDRFLFSSEWDSFFSQSFQEALPRWAFDHSPICLETNPIKWGPTPFRFENMWLLHPEFKEKFRVWWQEYTVEGWEGHKFMRKLKMTTGRRSGKFIKSLISERGETLSNIEVISEEIVNFFGKLYSKSEEEVRMTIFQLNKEKAPAPDGFTIAVYQECWDVIKEDLMRVFLEFHTKGVINQSTNATFIAMVPKKSQTFKISDYRPISLVTSLYKIIAKVLSGRLGQVLHETISGSQGAFVEGRQILDVVLIANEVVDEKRRSGEEGVVFKIDFEKAYDHVDWGFLDHGWVKASRGLRQGDPLSPFLFTLVADVLSRLMIRVEETGITEGFFVGRNRTRVSLLQFADDTIFFSKASMEHLQNLKIIILVFGQVSGLKINLEKNTISGLPLGGNPKTIGFWDPVVERISRRLDGKKDHLIRWEVVSRSKELGGLGFGKTSMRNNALLGKWLWSSLEKGVVFGIRLLRVYMGHILMDGTPTWWLDGHTDVHGRLLLKFSRFKSVVFVFVRIVFSEIFFRGLVKNVKSYLVPSDQVLVEFKSPFKGLVWFPPRSVEDMMVITFKGLGNSLRGKTLWQIACLTLIWLVWQERNNRIFEDKGRTEEMLWDLIRFYSSLWASCTEAFRGVPLSVLQLNWIVVCASKV
ncbi:Transposon TX1 uncharacterized 149 kDa protein [Vitis vinifera]|uniref:Transposon TX1 uncharacterized 149 kDa protein n=1 Tax=Vitis vinifera TaxID=29760 RepID=A0A438I8C7_VITVI|nr:Transposon TX1 uncharacterized 149 kDa protein [Vitis vinifera]